MPLMSLSIIYLQRRWITKSLKTAWIILFPLMMGRILSRYVPVEKGRHRVIMFSNRGVSSLTVEALRRNGFDVSVKTSSIRPNYLDARWEKVFLLREAVLNSGRHSTITWVDDDLFPDMRWLRRAITSKNYEPIFAGFEYGKYKNRIMSNLLMFRANNISVSFMERWAASHIRYLNKTTGVQDQDAINEIAKCNTGDVVCLTHSYDTVHTSGSSSVRVAVLNRRAREYLWEQRHMSCQIFLYALLLVLFLRMGRVKICSMAVMTLYKIIDAANMNTNIIIMGYALGFVLFKKIPTLNDIGRNAWLRCPDSHGVRRLEASTLSLGGRWLKAHGALVYADWQNRHEVSCLSGWWYYLGYLMEMRSTLSVVVGGILCGIGGVFVGCCVRGKDTWLCRAWIEKYIS